MSSSGWLKLAAGSNSHLNWLVSTHPSETDFGLGGGFGAFLLERRAGLQQRTLSAKGLGCWSEEGGLSLLGNKLCLSSGTEVLHCLLFYSLDFLLHLLSGSFGFDTLPPVLLTGAPLFLAQLLLPLQALLLLLDVGAGHLPSLTGFLHTRLAALVLAPCMLVVQSTLVVPSYFLLENSLLQPSWLANLGERAH